MSVFIQITAIFYYNPYRKITKQIINFVLLALVRFLYLLNTDPLHGVRGKNLHSQLFTKHNFMKKANVLTAINFNCHTSAVIYPLYHVAYKNKTRKKKQQPIKNEICRTNYSVKINFKFTLNT